MFSIHCKVLRIGRQKKKKAYWFKTGEKENRMLGSQKSPAFTCAQSLQVQYKPKKK